MSVKKPYWYVFSTIECPVCCRSETTKERVYDKPALYAKYLYRQVYDWCEG